MHAFSFKTSIITIYRMKVVSALLLLACSEFSFTSAYNYISLVLKLPKQKVGGFHLNDFMKLHAAAQEVYSDLMIFIVTLYGNIIRISSSN